LSTEGVKTELIMFVTEDAICVSQLHTTPTYVLNNFKSNSFKLFNKTVCQIY